MNAFILSIAITASMLSPFLSDDAYLDPGSGSFILQILIASLLGAGFLIKTYWQKIVSFFRERTSKSPDDE